MGPALAPSREDVCQIVTRSGVDSYGDLRLPFLRSLQDSM